MLTANEDGIDMSDVEGFVKDVVENIGNPNKLAMYDFYKFMDRAPKDARKDLYDLMERGYMDLSLTEFMQLCNSVYALIKPWSEA